MNNHERILKALRREEPDRVPTFTQTIEQGFLIKYDEELEITGEYGFMNPELELAKELGFDSKWYHVDGIRAPVNERPEIPHDLQHIAEGKDINVWGHVRTVSSTGDRWYYTGILKTPEFLKEWISFFRDFEPNVEMIEYFAKDIWEYGINTANFVPIPTLGGVAFPAWSSIGLDKFGYMMRKYPKLVRELVKVLTDMTLEGHKVLFENGIDMVFICDDYAQKGRLIFNPKKFDEFIGPAYKRLAENAAKYGAHLIIHSDGDTSDSIPTLIKAGVSAIEPLEYEAGMRVGRIKEKYGDKIAIIGNVPCSDALSVGSAEFTAEITRTIIKEGAPGGGFILAPGSDLLSNAKIENVKIMLETARRYGKYPIK